MEIMTAVAWIGIMFLIGCIIRVKIKPVDNVLIPACLIGGTIGAVLMNTIGCPGTETANYSDISSQLYTFMFINLGLTLPVEKDKRTQLTGQGGIKGLRQKMGCSMLSGIVGMGSYWALAYAFQALVAFYLLKLIGGIWNMDPVYGLTIPFAFAQGPGQAITYGTVMEESGWQYAVQVGITFAAIGFVVAFLLGIPFAKKGIKKGLACSKTKIEDDVKIGFIEPKNQETYGKVTTYGGNLDVMTFHIALVGLAWILGKYVVAKFLSHSWLFWRNFSYSAVFKRHDRCIRYSLGTEKTRSYKILRPRHTSAHYEYLHRHHGIGHLYGH